LTKVKTADAMPWERWRVPLDREKKMAVGLLEEEAKGGGTGVDIEPGNRVRSHAALRRQFRQFRKGEKVTAQ